MSAVGDVVVALAGPFVGALGKVIDHDVATGLHRVSHADGAYEAHYAADQLQVVSQQPAPAAPEAEAAKAYPATLEPGMPHTALARKQTPTYSGFRKYFPDAIAEVAKVSYVGNDQHNPGEPLHWARGKSMDQMDAADRHITDYAAGLTHDEKGQSTLAQAIWRLCAQLQLDIEAKKAGGK